MTERERLALTAAGRGGPRAARWARSRATPTAAWPRRPRPAASTGQRLGRVGDSPLSAPARGPTTTTVAVSCTGDGESIIRSALAHEVDALLRHRGLGLAGGLRAWRSTGSGRWGEDGGLIAVSAHGEVCATFNSAAMTRAWRVGDGPVVTAHGPGEGG